MSERKETILNVKDLNSCRTFYLDLLVDSEVITDGSFMLKIQNDNNILTLYSPSTILPEFNTKHNNDAVKIILTNDLMQDTYNKLLQYNVKIFSVHYRDNKETIIEAIECCDVENNLLIIKGKEGFSLMRNKFFSRTQVLKI
ncbi:MAG: hypothetical protein IJW31_07325 [Lentisphaeria bacterium]|nr:hypothetical protein [Lentisphaeria bacterium]MBR7127465.1 hypothetical protein [Lentisphaeria bacterium]